MVVPRDGGPVLSHDFVGRKRTEMKSNRLPRFEMRLTEADRKALDFLKSWHDRHGPKVAVAEIIRDAIHSRAEMVQRSDASYGEREPTTEDKIVALRSHMGM